jgi:hypothetical protein
VARASVRAGFVCARPPRAHGDAEDLEHEELGLEDIDPEIAEVICLLWESMLAEDGRAVKGM